MWKEFCEKENTPAKNVGFIYICITMIYYYFSMFLVRRYSCVKKLRAEASERGKQYQMNRPRFRQKGYPGLEETRKEKRMTQIKQQNIIKYETFVGVIIVWLGLPVAKMGFFFPILLLDYIKKTAYEFVVLIYTEI